MRSNLFRSLAILIIIPIAAFSAAAQFNGPESVEYDPMADRYFVSNTASNSIKILDQGGAVSDLATNLPNAPYGLELMDTVLYACMGSGVRGYSISTGEEVYYRNINAQFPNGITTDGSFLYITGFSSQQVYKVDPINDSHTTLVESTGGTPNGIVYDPIEDRIVVAFWGSNAPIKAYDKNSGEETILVANSGLGSIDGITIDCHGNFITASWSPARITRWEPTFTQAGVDLNVPGLGNPADIDFDHVNDLIAIPNTSLNTVILHEVNCTTSLKEELKEQVVVIPNPVRDLVHVRPAFDRTEPYIILDGRGLLIGGGTLRPNGMIDLSSLAAGNYILHFSSAGRQVKLVKE